METVSSKFPLWELIELKPARRSGPRKKALPSWSLAIVPVVMGLVVTLDLSTRYFGSRHYLNPLADGWDHSRGGIFTLTCLCLTVVIIPVAIALLWRGHHMRYVRAIAVGLSFTAGGLGAILLELRAMPYTIYSATGGTFTPISKHYVYDWGAIAGWRFCVADLAICIGIIVTVVYGVMFFKARSERTEG